MAQYTGRRLRGQFLRHREAFVVAHSDRIELYSSKDWKNPQRVIMNPDFARGVEWGAFELSPDDSHAVTSTWKDAPGGKRLLVLDLASGEVTASFDYGAYPAWRTALGPGGSLLAVAGPNLDTIEIWDVRSGTRLRILESRSREDWPNLERSIEKLSFSPDGRLVASVHLDGGVRIYDVDSGSEVEFLKLGLSDWRRTLAFAPDGGSLAILAGNPPGEPLFPVGRKNRLLSIWRTDEARFACRQPGWFWPASALAFSGDGRFLAAKEAFLVGRSLVRRSQVPPLNIQWFYVVYRTEDLED